MATPKCPQCSSETFSLANKKIGTSTFPILLVHCSDCGSVVGCMDGLAMGPALDKLRADLGKDIMSIQAKLNLIDSKISMLPKV